MVCCVHGCVCYGGKKISMPIHPNNMNRTNTFCVLSFFSSVDGKREPTDAELVYSFLLKIKTEIQFI